MVVRVHRSITAMRRSACSFCYFFWPEADCSMRAEFLVPLGWVDCPGSRGATLVCGGTSAGASVAAEEGACAPGLTLAFGRAFIPGPFTGEGCSFDRTGAGAATSRDVPCDMAACAISRKKRIGSERDAARATVGNMLAQFI